jgi:transposase
LLQEPLAPVLAYDFSLRFDDFYELVEPNAAEEYLPRWIAELHSSDLQPLAEFTRVLEDHWLGVMRSHHSRGVQRAARGLNSLIQAAKRCARGYRTNRNSIAMNHLVAGKLHAGPVVP